MEIKIIDVNNKLFGVQRTSFGEFHNYHERYEYIGDAQPGEVIMAKLIYQALYPKNQWAFMLDEIAENTDRKVRRVYKDV